MKIKIIDLLNMKSGFKKMPERICYDKRLWLLADDGTDYLKEDELDEIWLFQDYIPNNFDLLCSLNDELEIIEEEKEIEKINYEDHVCIDLSEAVCKKINELVDEINKLKKETEKENK